MQERELELFASCLAGLERPLADELSALGARRVRPLHAGVAFFCGVSQALRVCLWSRLASRVTLVVGRVDARNAECAVRGRARPAVGGRRARGREHGRACARDQRQPAQHEVHGAQGERRGVRPPARNARRAAGRGRARAGRARGGAPARGARHRVAGLVGRHALPPRLSGAGGGGGCRARVRRGGGASDAGGLAGGGACGRRAGGPACGEGMLACEAAGIACDLAPGLLRARWGFSGWALHDEDAWDALVDEADGRFEQGLAAWTGESVGGACDPDARKGARGSHAPHPVPARTAPARPRIAGVGASPAAAAPRARARQARRAATGGGHRAGGGWGRLPCRKGRRPCGGPRQGGAAPAGGKRAACARRIARRALACRTRRPSWKRALPPRRGARFAVAGDVDAVAGRFGAAPDVAAEWGSGRVALAAAVFDARPQDVCAVAVPDAAGGAEHTVHVREAASGQFAARLRKNFRERRKWARREGHFVLPHLRRGPSRLQRGHRRVRRRGRGGRRHARARGGSTRRRRRWTLSAPGGASKTRWFWFLWCWACAPTACFSKVRCRDKGGRAVPRRRAPPARGRTRPRAATCSRLTSGGIWTPGFSSDHRLTRGMVGAHARGARFLNLFAYTGTATVHAAGGGAEGDHDG